MGNNRKNLLWSLAALLIALITFRLIMQFAGNISWDDLWQTIQSADPLWLAAALAGMIGFVFFEGEAVLTIGASLGYPGSHSHGFLYAAADTYFSAITPSASGGQPASAFFMIRDGMPAAKVTAMLVFNVILYTLACLTNGVICILLAPQLLLAFSTFSRILIAVGLLVLIGLSVLFFLILKKRSWILILSRRFLKEKRQKKFQHMVEEYGEAVDLMTGKRSTIFRAFLCNLAQRICQISITFSVYMALGGSLAGGIKAYLLQSMVVLGSNSAPIPGSMGVTDYLMLDAYLNLMDRPQAVQLELLSRSISFYLCVLLCGLFVLASYLVSTHHRKKAAR